MLGGLQGLPFLSITYFFFREDQKMNLNLIPVPAHSKIIDRNVIIDQKDISLSEGVIYIKTENGRAIFEITSGKYSFTVENR